MDPIQERINLIVNHLIEKYNELNPLGFTSAQYDFDQGDMPQEVRNGVEIRLICEDFTVHQGVNYFRIIWGDTVSESLRTISRSDMQSIARLKYGAVIFPNPDKIQEVLTFLNIPHTRVGDRIERTDV